MKWCSDFSPITVYCFLINCYIIALFLYFNWRWYWTVLITDAYELEEKKQRCTIQICFKINTNEWRKKSLESHVLVTATLFCTLISYSEAQRWVYYRWQVIFTVKRLGKEERERGKTFFPAFLQVRKNIIYIHSERKLTAKTPGSPEDVCRSRAKLC